MWSGKRVLKKDKKKVAKKKLLLFSLVSGVVGVLFIAVGIVVLLREPVFISPLPIFQKTLGASADSEADVKQIASFLKENAIAYTEIKEVAKGTYEMKLEGGSLVYLTSENNLSEQLSSLQRIVSRLTMEGKKFTRLDLRYDKPVIVLE